MRGNFYGYLSFFTLLLGLGNNWEVVLGLFAVLFRKQKRSSYQPSSLNYFYSVLEYGLSLNI